jgi:UPF0716 protein FxsA
MVKWIIAAILLLPLAEIAVFVTVATQIGFGWALALVLLTTFAGAFMLRRAGRSRLAHFRVAVSGNDVTGIEADTGGLVTVLAGVLLFVPGFITDLIGLVLLIGPVRRMFGRAIRKWLTGRQRDRSVVDLTPGEWQKVPDRELPHRPSPPD